MDEARRRHRNLGSAPRMAPHKCELLGCDATRPAYPANRSTSVPPLRVARAILKLEQRRLVLESLQRRNKAHRPGDAAKFAVGDALQPDVLLHVDRVDDASLEDFAIVRQILERSEEHTS